MFKKIILVTLITLSLNAFEYRAYDIGGNEVSSQSSVVLDGEKYTLLPFSNLGVSKENVNLDGDFSLLLGKVNGKEIEPIKLASNYKYQSIVVQVFSAANILIAQSEEIYIDNDVKFFSINFEKE